MKYVLNSSKPGKGAQDFLKETIKEDQAKFEKIEKDLKEKETDLLKKKNILSKEEYQKKTDILRKEVIDFQSQRRNSLEKIAKTRAEARAILVKEINPILKTYITENGYSLVIDKKMLVAASSVEFDITNIIIEKLNKKLPSLDLK